MAYHLICHQNLIHHEGLIIHTQALIRVISLLCNNIPSFHLLSHMVTNGPNGFGQGFLLGCLALHPLSFWSLGRVLSATSIFALSWVGLPLLPLHDISFHGSFNCGMGALSLIGLPFFTSGGFYFAGLSFASCTFAFNLLSLAAWAITSFIGVPMTARGSFPSIALSSLTLVGFSWVWIPLFPCGVPF
jgi:hypothetical protein